MKVFQKERLVLSIIGCCLIVSFAVSALHAAQISGPFKQLQTQAPAARSREITGVDFIGTPWARSREIGNVDFIGTPWARSREITGVDFVGTPLIKRLDPLKLK
jgi:hypothetical protein